MILNEKTEREAIVKLLEYEDDLTKLLEDLRGLRIELSYPLGTAHIWEEIFGEYKDEDYLFDLAYLGDKTPQQRADEIIKTIEEWRKADNDI